MADSPADKIRLPRLTRGRAAAAAFGLGATLALSPMVWAENPASGPTPPAAPSTMTSPVALIQQQSFAPLVKKVLPAVVNISVTQKSGADQMSEEQEQFQGSPFHSFPNSPFDEMLRRFFDQQNPGGGEGHAFPQMPEGQAQRIALGSGFIVDAVGLRRDQQPRRRRRRQGRGHPAGQDQILGKDRRPRPQDRSRGAQDRRRQAAALRHFRRQQRRPGRRLGDRGRQSVRARRHGDDRASSRRAAATSTRGQFDDFLQIDAPINRGNSGGPTFNLEGQVIGINTAIYSPNGGSVGIGFAVPSNVAKNVVAAARGARQGRRAAGSACKSRRSRRRSRRASGSNEHGALVAVVNPDSPAAKAGLKQGDVVLAFNGADIDQAARPAAAGGDRFTGQRRDADGLARRARTELQTKLGEMPDNPRSLRRPASSRISSSRRRRLRHWACTSRR